jgi:cold shock CspA family protein
MVFKDLFGSNKDEINQEFPSTDIVRMNGKIIHLSAAGWGFITSEDIKFERIFFHWTGLDQDTKRFPELEKGMKVEFTPKEYDDKGWRAIRIKVVE